MVVVDVVDVVVVVVVVVVLGNVVVNSGGGRLLTDSFPVLRPCTGAARNGTRGS